jgi:four helix bundle protein
MSTQTFRDLQVWQKSMLLARKVYEVTAAFPSAERFGLINQLRRASVSIPSNIAEGQGRSTTGEFLLFLGHARGSLYEVQTQLLLSEDLNFLPKDLAVELHALIEEIGKLLNGLIKSLKGSR